MGKNSGLLKNDEASQGRLKEDLVSIIARWIDNNEQLDTEIPGLSFHRYDQPTEPSSVMYEPSVCLTVQGSKRVSLGEDVYVYDPYHLLITSIDLPTVAQVVEADKDRLFWRWY